MNNFDTQLDAREMQYANLASKNAWNMEQMANAYDDSVQGAGYQYAAFDQESTQQLNTFFNQSFDYQREIADNTSNLADKLEELLQPKSHEVK